MRIAVSQTWRETDNSDNDNDGTGGTGGTGGNEMTETCQDEHASNFGLAGECEYSDPGNIGGEGEEYNLGEDFTGDWGEGGPGTGQPTDNSCNNPHFAAQNPTLCNPPNLIMDDTAQEISGPILGSPPKLGAMDPFGGQ
tara:strand:+ start:1395 stop:1811 length:417 start_codon:yes stop_codon:yes gene_type:complete